MKIKNSCYVLQEQVWITVENYVKVAEVKMNMDISFLLLYGTFKVFMNVLWPSLSS